MESRPRNFKQNVPQFHTLFALFEAVGSPITPVHPVVWIEERATKFIHCAQIPTISWLGPSALPLLAHNGQVFNSIRRWNQQELVQDQELITLVTNLRFLVWT